MADRTNLDRRPVASLNNLRDNAAVPRAFLRIIVYPLALLGAAVFLVSVAAWCVSSWHLNLVNLLFKTWSNLLASISYTSLGVAVFFFVFPTLRALVSAIASGKFSEVAMAELKKSLAPDLIVGVAILTVVFGWSLVRTVHDDHQDLVNRSGNLKSAITNLSAVSTDKDSVISGLQAQLATYKTENTSLKSAPPRVVNRPVVQAPEFRASSLPVEFGSPYGKRLVRYILTTNIVMNGARVLMRCKGKIKGGNAQLAGVSNQSGGSNVVDDHTFRSDIESPNWAPGFPLVITIYYDEDALAPCSFNNF